MRVVTLRTHEYIGNVGSLRKCKYVNSATIVSRGWIIAGR